MRSYVKRLSKVNKLGYTKTYLVTGTRLESKDIAVLELLDEASSPNAVKTLVVRISPSDYEVSLSHAPIGSKVQVAITLIQNAPPEAPPPQT